MSIICIKSIHTISIRHTKKIAMMLFILIVTLPMTMTSTLQPIVIMNTNIITMITINTKKLTINIAILILATILLLATFFYS